MPYRARMEPMLPADAAENARTVYVERPGHGFAVASFTLAVCGIGFGLLPVLFPGALVFGALAVAYGVIGRAPERDGRGMALAGLVLGVVAVAVGVVGGVLTYRAVTWAVDEVDRLTDDFEQIVDDAVEELEAEVDAEVSGIEARIEGTVQRVGDDISAQIRDEITAELDEVKRRLDELGAR